MDKVAALLILIQINFKFNSILEFYIKKNSTFIPSESFV